MNGTLLLNEYYTGNERSSVCNELRLMRSFVTGRVSIDDRRSDISGGSSSASTLIRDSTTGASKPTGFQLRKFTAGVGRPGLAREAREAVRSVISAHSTSRRVTAVDPLDYEKFVSEKSVLLENDPQRELLMFPRDDVEEVVQTAESATVLPMSHQKEIADTNWLLTRDVLESLTSPRRSISFNYTKFAGDYDSANDESAETDEMLSSLVFESDMIAEEERVAMENTPLSDVVKEGYAIVLSDSGLLDNFKSAKRRYCTVKHVGGGEIAVDVRKSRDMPPKRPQMIISSVHVRSMRKGKAALEIRPPKSAKEKAEARDTLSLGSTQHDDSSGRTPNEPDSSSIGSTDSGRESLLWRGQRAVAKALQPPIVDRKNIFSLFSNLAPSPKPVCEPLSILCGSPSTLPNRKHSGITLVRFIIEFKKLELKLDIAAGTPQQIEPFYVTTLVFDASQGKRVSEEFRIDCNDIGSEVAVGTEDDDLSKTYGVSRAQLTARTASQMMFTTYSSPKDLWVVCYVDRMLSLDYTGDLYMKSTSDVKAALKLQKLIQSSSSRLAKYRQRFAWAARPLLEENLAREASNPRFVKGSSSMQLYRCDNNRFTDQDIQKYLGDFSKLEKASKSCVPNSSVSMKIDVISSLDEFQCFSFFPLDILFFGFLYHKSRVCIVVSDILNFPARVNPSFYALKPWKLSNDSPVAPVFELQTFGDPIIEPHSELFNLLYIYPLSLKPVFKFLLGINSDMTIREYFPKQGISFAPSVSFVAVNTPRPRYGGVTAFGLQVFYDRLHPSGPLVSSANCAVQYHQQFPQFVYFAPVNTVLYFGTRSHIVLRNFDNVSDEVKARLPVCLSTSDHLLFSFSHISVAGQTNPKIPESVETPIGYAWLPLMWKKDRLVMECDDQEFALPVAADLPDVYFRNRPYRGGKVDEMTDVKWVDQRALFRFRLRLVSSVFTTEPILQDFFQQVRSSSIPNSNSNDAVRSCSPLVRSTSLDDDHPLAKSILDCTNALITVETTKIVPFLNVILSRLLTTLTHVPTENLAIVTLKALVSICDRCADAGHKPLLRNFVRLHFVTVESAEGATHTIICRFLPMLIFSVQDTVSDLAPLFRQLWFIFDVIAKSIAQTIVRRSLLKVWMLLKNHFKCPRKERITVDVLEQIGSLVANVVPMLISKHQELPKECRAGISCIAFFLRCCLSFVDRGAVFKWINFVLQRLDECDSKVIRDFKLDVLTIISHHEHWLPLCLPVVIDSQNQIHRVINQPLVADYCGNSDATCSEEWYLNPNYVSHHFPSGIIFQELYACMREPREYRRRAIVILRNLLAKHSFDRRYLDMNIQRRIALLYLPFIRFAMDHINDLEDININDSGEASALATTNASVSEAPPPRSFGTCSTVFTQQNSSPNFALCERLDQEELQDILISVLYVIHRVPKRILGALCAEMKQNCVLQLLRLLELALNVFRYRGRTEPKVSFEKVSSLMTLNIGRLDGGSHNSISIPFRALQLLNLSQEVALIVLEVSQSLAQEFSDRHVKSHKLEDRVFSKLFSIYLALVDDHWPESVRLHAIAAVSVFINMFHAYLFEEGPLDELSLMIERLLIAMASRLPAVQNAAAALLHLVLRNGYETSQAYLASQAMAQSVLSGKSQSLGKMSVERLGRPGCQTSVALARLLGTKSTISSVRLEKGLSVLHNLSLVMDGKRSTAFGQAVTELVQQLRGVMSATVALKDAANDPIRLADLHLQLADSYRGSAALRSAWFDALADLHTAAKVLSNNYIVENWHAEASVCHAHSLAIIAKELAGKGLCKLDWTAFDWISSSVLKDEGGSEIEGSIQAAGFTLESLAAKIEQTAQALTLAERYEAIGPMYRLIIPMFEKTDNFKVALVGIYAELQQTYSRAAEVKASRKRHLGSYFRVRYFGEYHTKWDHGTDWIYREAGLASLAEVSLSLREYHRQLIGHDRIQVEPGSEAEPSALDPAVVYIWVNHVEPIVGEGFSSKHFMTHTNVSEFAYESPVSESSPGEGKEPSIVNQALRRTILKVLVRFEARKIQAAFKICYRAHSYLNSSVDGSFPSTRRRLPVVSVESEIIMPLDFACQKLESKASQINAVLDDVDECRPLDVKGLQLLLQGAVMPTVNAGPLAYAEAFTQLEQKERYGDAKINGLESAFRKLMSACERALQVNETAVAVDQQTYHEVLLASFEAMHERLTGFFGSSLRESRRDDADAPKTAIHVLDTIGGITA
uniref:Zizimin ortholog (inferred by orthology to a D. melanogaster protein) n=1 Tax=Nippostrongylus brasiliensis TaxID=27835 RepID=A0A158QXE6_NIPBR